MVKLCNPSLNVSYFVSRIVSAIATYVLYHSFTNVCKYFKHKKHRTLDVNKTIDNTPSLTIQITYKNLAVRTKSYLVP